MAHAFDGHSFQRLLEDVEHLFTHALEHEHRLTSLVGLIENRGPEISPADGLHPPEADHQVGVGAIAPGFGMSLDPFAAIRDGCVSARAQRQLAERLLTHLIGHPVHAKISGGKPVRVLVVDDSEDNREIVATVLESSGFHTITASNGLEAVVVAHYARPSVILMDVAMPVLDGLEAARLLKASAATQHLHVVAYTASPESCQGPLMRLFADVLQKPASPDALVASVQRFALSDPSSSSAGPAHGA